MDPLPRLAAVWCAGGRWALSVGLAAACLSWAGTAWATTVRSKSFDETVREADAICVARVTAVSFRWRGDGRRWIQTEYELQIEDTVLSRGPVAKGESVTLRFWGGSRDGEIQGIAGLPTLERGGRYVLMLHRQWAKGGLSPLVGLWHGCFPVVDRYAGKTDIVLDHRGVPLFSLNGGRVIEYAKAIEAKGDVQMVNLDDFVRLLRVDLPRIKALPQDERREELPEGIQPYARPQAPENTAAVAGLPLRWTQPRAIPLKRVFALDPPPSSLPIAGGGKATSEMSAALGIALPAAKDIFVGQCKLPIVVNQLPREAAPWSPVDQECMGYWNFYVKDVFAVRESPTAGVRWGDDSFDLHGLLSDSQYRERFLAGEPTASGWDEDVLGVTHFRMQPGIGEEAVVSGSQFVLEADIALNAAIPWTLKEEPVFEGQGVFSFRHTLAHELGHMAGLAHNWQAVSLMNYAPNELRAFPLPTMADTEALRARYDLGHVPRTDLAIYLFGCTADRQWFLTGCVGSGPDTRIVPGGGLAVLGYVLENAGTVPVAQPKLEWYLTPQRTLDGAKHFLGTTTYPPLAPGQFFDPLSVLRQMSVPADVAPGEYYLAAYVRDDQSPQLGEFPWDNNTAFSKQKIKVGQ